MQDRSYCLSLLTGSKLTLMFPQLEAEVQTFIVFRSGIITQKVIHPTLRTNFDTTCVKIMGQSEVKNVFITI